MKSQLPSPREQGFTIVEMMVGMMVGLIATVVMFQVFAVSEGQKRSTTNAGDAQQAGVFSVFQLERDTRMAGYGFNNTTFFNCLTNAWYEPANQAFNFRLLPVTVKNGLAGAPDEVSIFYGNSDIFHAAVELLNDAPATGDIKPKNRFPFQKGDLIVLGQVGRDCTLAQVQALPPGVAGNEYISRNSGPYVDAEGTTRMTKYNNAGGVPPGTTYGKWNPASSSGAKATILGSDPTMVTYRVTNNKLEVVNALVPDNTENVEIADNIVQFQAQFGYDGDATPTDGNVSPTAAIRPLIDTALAQDQWGDAMPNGATAAQWSRVVAVRYAIVARSTQPERPDPVTGVCNATDTFPKWSSAGNVDIDVSAEPEWKCYRYRTFEVTVPIRNLLWAPIP